MTEQKRANDLEWDLDGERKRLETVLGEIRTQIDKTEGASDRHQGTMRETKRWMWDEMPHAIKSFDDIVLMNQGAQEIRLQEKVHTFFHATLRKLSRMEAIPYFARFDFKEQGFADIESFYIDHSSLVDEQTGEHLVYDWRTPIASLFYDFARGPAEYTCQEGVIRGDISLKRQYKIVNGQLVHLFDSDVHIGDDVLQEMLGKSVDDRMRSIVTTIQREQNQVIRNEQHRLLIVQGVAGSGKTSIALQRVAYLLYRHRDTMQSDNVIIFSPNHMLNEYISNVLPELGEENLRQTTFQDYAESRLGSAFPLEHLYTQMEYVLTAEFDPGYDARLRGMRYKASPNFVRVLKNYVQFIEREGFAFEDILYGNETLVAKEELCRLFYGKYAFLPFSKRFESVKDACVQAMETSEIARRAKERPKETWLDSKRSGREAAQEKVQAIEQQIHAWEFVATEMSTLYQRLFADRSLFDAMSAGIDVPESFEDIRRETLARLGSGYIAYEEVAPLVYLKGALEGERGMKPIRHVVIDEAQDYSAVHFEVFKQLFPHCGLTVLGDLNQSIHAQHAVDYQSVIDMFGREQAAIVQLLKSYRSTQEITAFARGLLAEESGIEAIDRSGDKPQLLPTRSGTQRWDILVSKMAMLWDGGIRSMAIIGKTARACTEIYEQLSVLLPQEMVLELVVREGSPFRATAIVIPAYLVKGLEFDAVFVCDAGSYRRESERTLLYVACTRALHRLYVDYLHEDGFPAFIAGIEADRYMVYSA